MIPLALFNFSSSTLYKSVSLIFAKNWELSREFLFLGHKIVSVLIMLYGNTELRAKLKAMSIILLIFLRLFMTSFI